MTFCLNRLCLFPQNSDAAFQCHYCGAELLWLNRYRPIKLIGKGAKTRTFLAVDEQTPIPESLCIIKQFFNVSESSIISQVKKLKQISVNSLIPKLLNFTPQGDEVYLVQEFIKGNNLATELAENGCFSEQQIWQLLEQILPLLKFIHDHQLIHGDIKPENIIRRGSDNNLVLVDFGFDLGSSPEYAACETEITSSMDLYSLGVTCIHLLTDISPFSLFDCGDRQWVWQDYLTTPVSITLAEILSRLISPVVEHRFISAVEAIKAIGWNYFIPKTPRQSLWECVETLTPQTGIPSPINCVAISPNGKMLASGSDDRLIRLWQLNPPQEIAFLEGHTQAVRSVAFNNDNILASASDDRTIKLWDLTNFKELLTLKAHTGPVKHIDFSPDGQILASASWDKTVKLWDVYSGELLHNLTAHKLQVLGVAFSNDSQWLATTSIDRTLRLWKLQPEPKLHRTLGDHIGSVTTVAFSTTGRILATGSDDRTIKIWDQKTGKVISTFSGHSWSIVSLVFTPDGEMLISGSWDKTIKIWQINTGEQLAQLSDHSDSVSSIAISFDGQIIASASKDKTLKLWKPIEV